MTRKEIIHSLLFYNGVITLCIAIISWLTGGGFDNNYIVGTLLASCVCTYFKPVKSL